MPHMVLERVPDFEALEAAVDREPVRWGRAVLRSTGIWRRSDPPGMLVEGVVVELSRPLHPVAFVAPRRENLMVRLWPLVTVERTPAVQRWLATIAAGASRAGAGRLVSTNLPAELWEDLARILRE